MLYNMLTDQQKNYIHQLSADTGCCLDDLLKAMAVEMGGELKGSILSVHLHDDDDNDMCVRTRASIKFSQLCL